MVLPLESKVGAAPVEDEVAWFWALKVWVVVEPLVVTPDQLPTESSDQDREAEGLAIVSSWEPLSPEAESVPRAKAVRRPRGS